MKKFEFYIQAERCTYSITMENLSQLGQEFVAYDKNVELRHPDFRLPFGASSIIAVSMFTNDLYDFVNRINEKGIPVSEKMLEDILEDICADHIREYGRLLYFDFNGYLDLYIHIYYAIFESELSAYHNKYRAAILRIVKKFPDKILIQGPLGELSPWASFLL